MTDTLAPASTTTTHAEAIRTQAMLGTFKSRLWGGSKTDNEVTNRVAEWLKVSANAGRYSKKLAGDPDLASTAKAAWKRLWDIKTEAYNYFVSVTVPGFTKGTRIYSVEAHEQIVRRMREYEAQFAEALEEFVPLYPTLVVEAKADLNGAWKAEDYPPQDRIASRFMIAFRSMVLPDVEQTKMFKAVLGDAEVERIIKEGREDLEDAFEAARMEVYGRIFKEVEHMAERLNAYEVTAEGTKGIFRNSLVDNIRALLKILPLLNITGDPELIAITDAIDKHLTHYDAEVLRASDSAREKTAKAAAVIAEVASAATESDPERKARAKRALDRLAAKGGLS